MPNHIINELVFVGNEAARDHIIASACGSDGKVDFNILVPMPANIWRGNVGSIHEQTFGKEMCGLGWARCNWGTKWGAYRQEPPEIAGDMLILRFQTAWSPPYPWLVAIFNTCGDFDHHWLDEGRAAAVTGTWKRIDNLLGEEWKEAPATEAVHRHLHKLLWGVEEFAEEDEAASA